MHIIIEEHKYPIKVLGKTLDGITNLRDVNGMVSVNYVGYYYNPTLKDCVFILPKVLLTEQETLVGMELPTGEQVNPEQVLTPEGQKKLSKEYRKFGSSDISSDATVM